MRFWNIAVSLIFYVSATEYPIEASAPYSPLIIVPGFAGSREYFQGPKQKKPQLVWVDPIYIEETSKLNEYLALKYNVTSRTTYSPHGYKYIWRGWGQTNTIEKLSNVPLVARTDYHKMIQKIVKNKYYVRNHTLRGAPYDFRKAPNEMKEFFGKLKLLIEETYWKTGNNRVVLLGHSLGAMFSLSFINQMKPTWKKQYLKAYISVSGPLGGAVQSLLMETTGKSVVFFKSPLVFREFERTFPSTAFLLPKPKYFTNRTLVQTRNRKYSAQSYKDLFRDINLENGYAMYNEVKNLVDPSVSPTGIDKVYCIHGYGLPTLESYSLNNFNDEKPHMKYGPGDETVNQVSLEICQTWKNVDYTAIPRASHKKILHNDIFINKLMMILANK